MKKLLFSIPFLLYFCIAPVNYDKAGIKEGGNYYMGVNVYGESGKYTTTTCSGYSAPERYTALGIQGNIGGYYGFNKYLAFGGELSAGLFQSLSTSIDTPFTFVWGYGDLFFKTSIPFKNFVTGLKFGFSYPYVYNFTLLVGFPNPEVLTIAYSNRLNTNSISINYRLQKSKIITLGYYNYYENPDNYSDGFYLGIGIRK